MTPPQSRPYHCRLDRVEDERSPKKPNHGLTISASSTISPVFRNEISTVRRVAILVIHSTQFRGFSVNDHVDFLAPHYARIGVLGARATRILHRKSAALPIATKSLPSACLPTSMAWSTSGIMMNIFKHLAVGEDVQAGTIISDQYLAFNDLGPSALECQCIGMAECEVILGQYDTCRKSIGDISYELASATLSAGTVASDTLAVVPCQGQTTTGMR
ncbi:hypothetical protein BC936DRAFT_146959 [Jimgerdemannia flammicorona]|uniref:Uncharacterized protein n=1 Tax=Jimgerdemannia flammicorona TaxID=994334 RepID=A0A433DL48_9FUNG|nr:hypothetical protein BC936DRAFT_146959 [Jimgerdemannia flammicorona]